MSATNGAVKLNSEAAIMFEEFMGFMVMLIIGMMIIGLISSVVIGVVTHRLAAKKGWKGYFWTGFFLNVIGLIYVVGLPVKEESPFSK